MVSQSSEYRVWLSGSEYRMWLYVILSRNSFVICKGYRFLVIHTLININIVCTHILNTYVHSEVRFESNIPCEKRLSCKYIYHTLRS